MLRSCLLLTLMAAVCGTSNAAAQGPVLLPPVSKAPAKKDTGSSATDTEAEETTIRSRKRRTDTPDATETAKPDPAKAAADIAMKSAQMREVIRGLVLQNVPHEYEDLKHWNKTKEVTSGLNVKLDGLRLRTKRRRKTVNHGSWKRYNVQLPDKENQFDFKIENVKSIAPGEVTFRASVVTPLKVIARLQEWSYGARLMSISTDADARVRLHIDCYVAFEMDGSTFPPAVVIRPKVKNADIKLIDFRLNRVSHLKGSLANEIGRGMRGTVEKQIDKKRQKLPEKINKQIAKKQDKLRLSLSDMLSSKWGKTVNPTGKTKPETAAAK